MNVADVEERLAKLVASEGDPEKAHGREDAILSDFVRAVAEGTVDDAPACAALIAAYLDVPDLVRWYA